MQFMKTKTKDTILCEIKISGEFSIINRSELYNHIFHLCNKVKTKKIRVMINADGISKKDKPRLDDFMASDGVTLPETYDNLSIQLKFSPKNEKTYATR